MRMFSPIGKLIALLAILLVPRFTDAAEPASAFGPDLVGIRLGMSPTEVRTAIAARRGVSVATLSDWPGRPGVAKPSAPGKWRYEERIASYYPYGQALCQDSVCPRGWKEGDPLGSKLEEFEYVLSIRFTDQTRLEAGMGDYTTTEVKFSRVPGAERVISVFLEQYYPNGTGDRGKKVDHRPTQRTALQALDGKLGTHSYCDPIGFIKYSDGGSKAEFKPKACYWQPGDARHGKLAPDVHPSLSRQACRDVATLPDSGATVSFAKGNFAGPQLTAEALADWNDKQERLFSRPSRKDLGVTLSADEACGDVLFWAVDVTDAPQVENDRIQKLYVYGVWIGGALESLKSAQQASGAGTVRWEADLKRWAEIREKKAAEAAKKDADINPNRPSL